MANAANKHSLEDVSRREKGKRNSDRQGVRYLMAEPIGRAMAWRLLQIADANIAVAFSANAMVLSFNAGVQKVGHWLLDEIRDACPELEPKMRLEAQERAKLDDLIEEHEDDR